MNKIDKTVWTKEKVYQKTQNSDTNPSNLTQLPLETYMIPVNNNKLIGVHDVRTNSVRTNSVLTNNVRTDDVSKDSVEETTQTFQDMTTEQKTDFLKSQYTKYMRYINASTSYIDAYETSFATLLAETFSGKTNTSNDVIIIKKNLVLFLNACISCYIVYNWYFIMFFLDDSGDRVNTLTFSLQSLRERQPLVHMVFKYTLCVLSMMITTLLEILPRVIRSVVTVESKLNRRIQFIILLGIIMFIIMNLGTTILNSVSSTYFVGVFSVIFILYGIYSFVSEFTSNDPLTVISKYKKYLAFGQFTPLLYLLLFCSRIIWSITIVSVTGISNCLYLLFSSFFAIVSYSNNPFFDTFRNIHKFVRSNDDSSSDFAGVENKFNCEDGDVITRFINISRDASGNGYIYGVSSWYKCIQEMHLYDFIACSVVRLKWHSYFLITYSNIFYLGFFLILKWHSNYLKIKANLFYPGYFPRLKLHSDLRITSTNLYF